MTSTQNLLFLTAFLCSFVLLTSAKPTESKNGTLAESRNVTVSDITTKRCFVEAPLNKTAKDICSAFSYCCGKRCPKRGDNIDVHYSYCYKEDDFKISTTSTCKCGPDIDTSGMEFFLNNLGLIFKILALLFVLSILACVACCVYACCK